MTHVLPTLPYAYHELDPYIDAKTMEIHHSKHHAAYIKKLNAALADAGLTEKPLLDILAHLDAVPQETRAAIRNNGGGHVNHTLFWETIAPNPAPISAAFLKQIETSFGSFDQFKAQFSQAAATQFGSGWAWLGVQQDGRLNICATPNQDTPLMKGYTSCACTAILGVDVWEHAYYLQYQNRRPDYINAFFNVVNWSAVEEKFQQAC